MDPKPFLEFEITSLKDNMINEIAKFHKSSFDVNHIVSNASSLKYIQEIRKQINDELSNPSNEFVKLFANKVYSGRLTEKVMDEFKDLVQKGFNQFISDKINDRLKAALTKESQQQEEPIEPTTEDSKICTSEEELEAYRIVVAILRRKLPTNRIVSRDTQSYFGVLLDDNNRKPLCRLHLNGGKKYIGLFNADKSEVRQPIQTIDDLYLFEKELLETVVFYEGEKQLQTN
jgi:predicted type IV restriction endonuclease